ncbi:MAG TPA: redoxin domain-containing protein [Vicinamibacteria bacterium]
MATRPSILAALVLAAAFGVPGPADADEAPAVPILAKGSAAPDFDLPAVDGRRYSLKDFASSRLLVLVFTCNHCPTAQAYEDRLQKLHDDYAKKGVAVVAVSPNDPKAVRLDELGYSDLGDSLEDMKLRAQERNFTFPYLYDGDTQAMTRKYGPVATPHVFVFDQAKKLRFVGRIDDAENPAKTKVHDTRVAIDALLAGQPVPVEQTKVFGCSIKWANKGGWVDEGRKRWAEEAVSLTPTDAAGLRALARNESKKLRLINVWATWCGPCVIEFPDLVTIHRMYRGRDFEIVTVSADPPEKRDAALAFLREKQASTRNYVFETGDPYAMIDAVDVEWQGALPHTMLVAPGGKVIYRSQGAFEPLALRRAIVGYIGRYYHSVPGK